MKTLALASGTFLSGPSIGKPLPGRVPLKATQTPDPLRQTALAEALAPEPVKPSQRRHLWELAPHLHCSVIGTCLSLGDLRALARRLTRHAADDYTQASDHELHELVVGLGRKHDAAGKLLHKCLDGKHAGAVRRFCTASDIGGLKGLWRDAVHKGEIPGAYWAVLTHPATDECLLRQVLGEVHMLSHLVGASNRADLRRLHALEQENADLRDAAAAVQNQYRARLAERDGRIGALEEELALNVGQLRLARSCAPSPSVTDASLRAEFEQERLARERAEERLVKCQGELVSTREHLAAAHAEQEISWQQIQILERQLVELLDDADAENPAPRLRGLNGSRVLLVGARPAQVGAGRSLIERLDGIFMHHDGGIDDNIGTLAGLVSRADQILVPMDCVSHEAVRLIKRSTAALGKAWLPLRSASLAALAQVLEPALGSRLYAIHGDSATQAAMLER